MGRKLDPDWMRLAVALDCVALPSAAKAARAARSLHTVTSEVPLACPDIAVIVVHHGHS